MNYDDVETGLIGALTLAGDEAGLRHIFFPQGKKLVFLRDDWKRTPEFFKSAKAQLRAYFNGELTRFELSLAPVGTPFQQKVWNALQKIPYGKLVTYQMIAEAVGSPKAARAVGGAAGNNPIPIIVPCHRVIGSNGALTGFGGGLAAKRRLIQLERTQR
ncbi:MAG: methylated-DNA--[protein]-cysteine S-methyltransferase [Desulfobacterales bacterium]|jgi:methylated-DNA-[protein]-cysteine S-methyltransferase|nr:methylated-DNA--[protein]-cysteine S-methyltransferase [Desulfobacterales bacterium]